MKTLSHNHHHGPPSVLPASPVIPRLREESRTCPRTILNLAVIPNTAYHFLPSYRHPTSAIPVQASSPNMAHPSPWVGYSARPELSRKVSRAEWAGRPGPKPGVMQKSLDRSQMRLKRESSTSPLPRPPVIPRPREESRTCPPTILNPTAIPTSSPDETFAYPTERVRGGLIPSPSMGEG